MQLFVTGTESFIGRALRARSHAEGIAFTGVDAAGQGTERADIRNPALADVMPEGATVVHLAAMSRDPDCRADPAGAFDINVNGTLNVAAAARRRKAPQLIFASTEWVYGEVSNDEIQREDRAIDVTRIKSEYAFTKIVGEQGLRMIGSLPTMTILRFGIVYGSRSANWSAVESLFNTLRTANQVKIGAAATARRFIHVDDIVSGILASVGRTGFETFNLSGDRLVTLGEVVETSSQLLGRKVELIETNPAQPSVRNPHNGKAREALGWAPKVSLADGLTHLHRFLETA